MLKQERRKYPRDIVVTTIDYAFSESIHEEVHEAAKRAVTVNVSNSGLCLYLFSPVREGQEIKLYASFFPEHCKCATVRWVKKISSDLFKVGLMCKE